MRIATWNVNSLKARLAKLEAWLERARPDVLLLQETKSTDAAAPHEFFRERGYELAHHGEGRWNGVALASRRGLAEVQRVLRPAGTLRMLEHVRSTTPWKARLQDRLQPAWTRFAGGCHPNRDTERLVETSGFVIDQASRRAEGNLRRFAARPL